MLIATALLFGLAAANAPAPPVTVRAGDVAGQPGWRFYELDVDLARASLRIVDAKGGAPLQAMLPKDAWAGVNGGYWMEDYRPTGWVRDAERVVRGRGKDPTDPRAGVLAVKGAAVYVGRLAGLPFTPELAIQMKPLLVLEGRAVEKASASDKRAARTVACRPEGSAETLRFVLVVATPGMGPTLRETAELVAKPRAEGGFACRDAINLDGGRSTGLWLRESLGVQAFPPLVPIGYGIAVIDRKGAG